MPEIFTNEQIKIPEHLPANIELLSEQEIKAIAQKLNLPETKVKEKIIKGINLLYTSITTSNDQGISLADFHKAKDKFQNEQKIENINQPVKLTLTNSSSDDFCLYMRNDKLLDLLVDDPEKEIKHSYKFPISYEGNSQIDAYWLHGIFKEEELAKIIGLSYDAYPHEDKLFTYQIFDKNKELDSILVMQNENTDQKVHQENENFTNIFFRDVNTAEDEQLFSGYIKEFDKQLQYINNKLKLPPDLIKNLHLILCADNYQYGAFTNHYTDIHNNKNHLIIFSKNRMQEMDGYPESRDRLFRHEYLHIVDKVLGDDNNSFSQLVSEKIMAMFSQELFSGQPVKEYEEMPGKINWPDRPKVWFNFTESHLFEGPGLGHADENIKELVASALNNFLDPEFEQAIDKKDPEDIPALKKIYQEIWNLFQQRVQEINRKNKG